MDEQRLTLAEEFLQEAVYRSRSAQAFTTAIQPSTEPARARCGLGERAAIVLELSERGRELFEALWRNEAKVERIQRVTKAWIGEQDALDRRRNHFLKAFRGAHGFDRTRYTPAESAEYDLGLEGINRDEDRKRRAAASELLADR